MVPRVHWVHGAAADDRTGRLTADLRASLVATTPRIGRWLDRSDRSVEATVDAILDRTEAARVQWTVGAEGSLGGPSGPVGTR